MGRTALQKHTQIPSFALASKPSQPQKTIFRVRKSSNRVCEPGRGRLQLTSQSQTLPVLAALCEWVGDKEGQAHYQHSGGKTDLQFKVQDGVVGYAYHRKDCLYKCQSFPQDPRHQGISQSEGCLFR